MAKTVKERIRFACEECDQLLSIGVSRVGQKITCPKCSAQNAVPNAEEAAAQLVERKKRKQARQDESGDDFSQFAVYDDDTEFIFETEDEEGYYGGKVDRSKVAVPRFVLYTQGALLGVVAVTAFVFGWFVGAVTSGPSDAQTEDSTPKVVSGTITFADSNGRQQPDADSVVVLLPLDSLPSDGNKITVDGLRPIDAPPEDTHPSVRQIIDLDGAYARTRLDGTYRLQVPQRGRYYLLVISGNSQRASDDELNDHKDKLAKMSSYFEGPLQLLGPYRFRWTLEKIGHNMTKDVSFGS